MDKNTFASYGWIVCVVIVIAIMIGMATPFGNYITAGVNGSLSGFKGTTNNALDNDPGSPGGGNEEDGNPDDGSEEDGSHSTVITGLQPGVYAAGAITLAKEGNLEQANAMLQTSWDDLIAGNKIKVSDSGEVSTTINAMNTIKGDLVLPEDGSITSIAINGFGYAMYMEGIYIPSSVVSIGSSALYNTKIQSVDLPYGLTTIGDAAFSSCKNLTSIEIPASVTSIEGNPFPSCSALNKITVESGSAQYHVDNNCLIETATKRLVSGCKSSVIPTDGSVTIIGDGAFYGCTYLTSVTIPDSVTEIEPDAFGYCSSLESVNIGKNNQLNSIGYKAFNSCTSLTSIELPASLTTIDYEAFSGCTNLASVKFGENSQLTAIGMKTFYNCKNLTAISLPSSVESIGKRAFENCTSLASVTFGENSRLTIIDDFAFWYCESLTSITIPANVTTIGSGAFYTCKSLSSVTFEDVNGWYVHGSTDVNVTVTDATTNAQWLTSSMGESPWYKTTSK